MRNLISFLGVLLLFNCHGQTAPSKQKDCEVHYLKFAEKADLGQFDSADFHLTKAFRCDTSNLQYAIELYSLKINTDKTEEALNLIEKMQKLTPAMELEITEELLKYDLSSILDTTKLYGYYKKYKSQVSKGKKISETDLFYYVALSDFVKGKEEAMKELTRYRRQVESNTGLLTMIEKLISDKDSLYVIRKAFNVR